MKGFKWGVTGPNLCFRNLTPPAYRMDYTGEERKQRKVRVEAVTKERRWGPEAGTGMERGGGGVGGRRREVSGRPNLQSGGSGYNTV